VHVIENNLAGEFMKHIPAAVVLLAVWSSLATATTVRRLDFDQLVAESELIVHARVVGSQSYIMPSRGWILTDTRIEVLDTVKGSPARFITVTELGGVVGDTGMIVPGTARFRQGEEAVVFLKNVAGRWRTSGLIQGKFPIVEERGEKMVTPAVPMADSGGRISLRDLLGRVRRMDRARRQAPR
jgi:hypothetical protein